MDDWKEGNHKIYCKSYVANAEYVKSIGGGRKDLKSSDALFVNVRNTGMKFLAEKTYHILFQSVLKDYDILDCIVEANLISAPYSFELRKRDDFLKEEAKRDPEMADNTAKLIDNFRAKGWLASTLKTQTMFVTAPLERPCAHLGITWPDAKKKMEEFCLQLHGTLDYMRRSVSEDPALLTFTTETSWTALSTVIRDAHRA